MKKITIEVNENAANKWNKASKDLKLEVALFIEYLMNPEITGNDPHASVMPEEKVLKNHFKKVQANLASYSRFRDKVSDIASKNGLTEEILDDILKINE